MRCAHMNITDLDIDEIFEEICLTQQVRITLYSVGNLYTMRIQCAILQRGTYFCLVHLLPLYVQLAFVRFAFLLLLLPLCGLLHFRQFGWRRAACDGFLKRQDVNWSDSVTIYERACGPVPPGHSEVHLLPCSRPRQCTRSRHRLRPRFPIPFAVTHAVNIAPSEGNRLLACLDTTLLGITSLNTSSSICADVSWMVLSVIQKRAASRNTRSKSCCPS